jgi:hypothetical protein
VFGADGSAAVAPAAARQDATAIDRIRLRVCIGFTV